MKKYTISERDLLNIFSEVYFLDSELFKLGTKLGAIDATQDEIRNAVYNFFVEKEIPHRFEKIRDLIVGSIKPDFFTEKQKNKNFFIFYEKWLSDKNHLPEEVISKGQ